MPVPFRLQVLRAVTATIEATVLTNTENTDYQGLTLEGRVFRGRLAFGDSDPVPMVSIIEQIDEGELFLDTPDGKAQRGQMKLVVQGWVDDDDFDNPGDTAQWLMADVKKALTLSKQTRPEYKICGHKKIVEMRIGRGVVRPPEEGISSKAHFALGLTLVLSEQDEDPYS